MIDRFKVQDAYHYALAAAGDEDSAFRSRRGERSRSDYLRRAFRKAVDAGLPTRHTTLGLPPVRRPQSLKDARRLADDINESARAAGIDANTGEASPSSRSRDRRRARDPQRVRAYVPGHPGFFVDTHRLPSGRYEYNVHRLNENRSYGSGTASSLSEVKRRAKTHLEKRSRDPAGEREFMQPFYVIAKRLRPYDQRQTATANIVARNEREAREVARKRWPWATSIEVRR